VTLHDGETPFPLFGAQLAFMRPARIAVALPFLAACIAPIGKATREQGLQFTV